MRVLSWNLFHGRSVSDTPRELLPEFGARLAAWEWDVALLQEVPPWWAPPLADASGAEAARTVLTSRNELLPLRRALARRRPDLLRSGGGGANVILVRGSAGVVQAHARRRIRCLPERRVVHAVALRGGTAAGLLGRPDGVLWVANVHCSTAARGVERVHEDVARAAGWLRGRAATAGQTCVLGGDLNVRAPRPPGLAVLASSHVDHVCATGDLRRDGEPLRPGRTLAIDGREVALSDHAPLVVALRRAGAP